MTPSATGKDNQGRRLRRCAPLLLLAVWLVLSACAAKAPEGRAPAEAAPEPPAGAVYPRPDARAVQEQDFGPVMDLRSYLRATLKKQYFTLDSLYEPPDPDFARSYYVQLAPEQAVLHLARNVAAYAADENGLAVALDNGDVRVYGEWPCPGVALPAEEGAGLVAWEPESPYLLLTGRDRERLHVFDLRRCGQVAEHALPSKAAQAAVSPRGTWMSVVDEVHDLYVSRTGQPPQKISRLRYVTLDLAFTPKEGLLMAVDQGGWVTLWSTHEGELLDSFRIPGGPFARAAFDGPRLHLTGADGKAHSVDLTRRQTVAPMEEHDPFLLTDGVLYYRTWQQYLIKKMHLGRPGLAVWHSPSTGLLKVRDVDGRTRHYAASDGFTTPAPPQGADPEDWRRVDVGDGMGFVVDGRDYVLADPVYRREHMRLWCRHVPGQGFFLWWERTVRPGEYDPNHGELPMRESLLADVPVRWERFGERPVLP